MTYDHENQKISNSKDVARIVRAILCAADYVEQKQEHFFVIGLNGANRIEFINLASLGLVDQAPVHPREVFRMAIHEACSAIIVAHNHPSGQCEPSREDTEVTRRLKAAGDVLGISVLDHLIVTDSAHYSFAEQGLL